ncbi:hypothetical protein [Pseudalkalibacillus berkeleyi]|uniref:Uncharacterized protein n=1 Tax=Pseudalkalibacillus berkeleyi TaxID=1069813 RepID=A0ABS9H0G6_9BACL|nr:hypothetical protein [Pseudalkalibacillus berkeleyi]MCF6137330.1 hypothetical protein [Pseudalkalibacillus berkeleyi]
MSTLTNRLEYRLFDERNGFPALYHYEDLSFGELFSRRLCDFYVKKNQIYTKTSTSYESNLFVIYLSIDTKEEIFDEAPTYEFVTLEIREWKQYVDSPILQTVECQNHEEVLAYISSDYVQLTDTEYERVATEIDEDRRAYVMYVKPSSL